VGRGSEPREPNGIARTNTMYPSHRQRSRIGKARVLTALARTDRDKGGGDHGSLACGRQKTGHRSLPASTSPIKQRSRNSTRIEASAFTAAVHRYSLKPRLFGEELYGKFTHHRYPTGPDDVARQGSCIGRGIIISVHMGNTIELWRNA
jgi:hypothetical protein